MKLTLDISDDLRPDEASELLEIAKTEGKPIGRVLLEAAREWTQKRRAARAQQSGQPVVQAA
jgi:hypothetical protein